MHERTKTSDQASEPSVSPTGEGLRLHLQCPKCNTAAWVDWRQLPHLLRCRGCRNSFWIDRSGHVQSEHEVGTVRVECPRCHHAREWPKGLAIKQFNCLVCGFDVSPIPDSTPAPLSQRLAASQEPPPRKKKPRQSKPLPPAAIVGIVAGVLVVLCLLIFAAVRGMQTDKTLVEAVQAFSAAALLGESEKAKPWVAAGQEVAFESWMFTNTGCRPLVRFEPVEVKILQYSSSAARVTVSYQRTIQDTHEQCQCWRRASGGRWEFDPAATLQQQ